MSEDSTDGYASDTERLSVEDVVDHEDNCAACGVHERVEDSRYCAGCRDALVRADGGRRIGDAQDLARSLRITAEAEEEYDVCPDCGKEFIDLDTTLAGDLVFIHEENPLKDCTVDTDTQQSGGGDGAE